MCALARCSSRPPPRPRTQSLTFEATSDLKDPATRDQAFKDIAALGVHSMRVVLYWHDVAPEPDSRIKPSSMRPIPPATTGAPTTR